MSRARFIGRFILVQALVLIFSGCASLAVMGSEESWARATVRRLSLREKIAQMMIYTMNMRFLNEDSKKWTEIEELITSDGIGGIHLWYGDAGSSLTMMNRMQRMSKVPILFDADIERGLHQRYPGATALPVLMAVGATGNPDYAYEAGRITALEGKALGIHLNLMPVVDVNNNPANPIINTRSYGEDPDMVIEYSRAFILGMRDHGMLGTAKHFPGHGDTETDSHSNLAAIPSDSARLWSVELPPFIDAVSGGIDLVMTTHVQAPDYQPHAGTPATLSKFWITDVLKGRLGFKGTVITDAMGMGGVTQNFTDAFALVEAINAGNDLIIQNYDFRGSVDIVEQAVREGLISEARITEAATKVLLLKARAGLHKSRYTDYGRIHSVVGRAEFRTVSREIAAKAVTLVKNEGNLIPLRTSSDEDTVYVIDLYDYPYNHSLSQVTRRVVNSTLPAKAFQLDESDGEAVYRSVLEALPADARVVMNVFASIGVQKDRIFLPDNQVAFIKAAQAKTKRLSVTSFGTPYLIQAFPQVPAYITAYHYSGLMQSAVVDALMGNQPISGRLPITIPGVAERGTGIQLPQNPLLADSPPGVSMGVRRGLPKEVGANTAHLNPLLEQALADSAWPGGVLLAAKDGLVFLHEAFGTHTYARKHPTTRGDIFDLASITKVVATTAAVMKLYDGGHIKLDAPLATYLPRFEGPDAEQTRLKATITIRQVLYHGSGLPSWKAFYRTADTPEQMLAAIYATPLDTLPGTRDRYSGIGLMLLGELVEAVSGMPLDAYVKQEIYDRLGMNSTYFNPPPARMARLVPTEYSDAEGNFVRGHVHDENAYTLGGVAGNAGLFSTAADLAKFSQMMLNRGVYRDSLIYQPETVDLFTRRANAIADSPWCLGWDSPAGEASAGIYASSSSYGHTGFTGTSLWIDPEKQLIVILLTNAVHPNRTGKGPDYCDWRQRLHSAVYESFSSPVRNPTLELKPRWASGAR